MKKRLIDANALHEYIQKEKAWKQSTARLPRYDQGKYDAYYEMLKIDAYYEMLKIIEDQPTVDAVEVVHADIVYHLRRDGGYKYSHCTNCGEEIETSRPVLTDVAYCGRCGKRLCSRFTDYCPNCGARMDGKAGETSESTHAKSVYD